MKKTVSLKSGFTLLEILLVVGIISILAGIVILAINPTKQLGDTRNAQRRADVLTIINAIYQYTLDDGQVIADLRGGDGLDDDDNSDCDDTDTDAYDLLDDLVTTGNYLTGIPRDPITATATSSGYYIDVNTSGRITVCAPASEADGASSQIEVTR